MKKILIVLACMTLCASLSFALPATCQSLAGSDVNNGPFPTGSGGAGGSITCINGPLTFSTFQYSNNGGDPNPLVSLTNPQPNAQGDGTDRVGSDYFLGLNPNLTGIGGPQDVHLIFEVTGGGVTQVSLADPTGTGSGISETVCGGSATQTAAALSNFQSGQGCGSLAGGVQLALMSVNDGGNVSENITSSTVLWIYKDINVISGGHLSAFSQDFLVPEPATLLLIGGGLAVLGLVHRRKKA